ncbi:hypothetical protein G3M56_005915 [Sulfuriroseicoccus oceanibius]|uniref:DUF4032 domain-containing protein n=2 Tax=Sulfuriroseicoccus oceanibius TaxID=2707525 RepID=A0A6B3L1D4_9BACT|nr:hypothetical protein G3M56_005915 [Sulfuriroseicoccus oceanibius]
MTDSPSDKKGKASLYQEFLFQLDEIHRHKWIESEKRGYDVGLEFALVDWIRNHRDEWRKKWLEEQNQ